MSFYSQKKKKIIFINHFSSSGTKMSHGSLRICLGPMFSGKTTWLNGELTELADFGLACLKVIHKADQMRDAELTSSGHSHSSSFKMLSPKIDVIFTDNLLSIIDDIDKYNIVGIDEGQFFDELVKFVKVCLTKNIHVLVAGLDGDFKQEKFGHILDIIPMCDEVQKKSSRCRLCLEENLTMKGAFNPMNLKAPFTVKFANTSGSSSVIDIGGEDKYMPVCRYHHK
jgi:thymidine kinase